MGSVDNWLDIPQQRRQALAFVVSDADQTVDVFRRLKQAGVAGLTEETKDQQPLRTTRIRIDFSDGKPVALTNDTDVRVDDAWRVLDDRERIYWYRVAGVTRSRGASRVTLEELKR